MMNNNDFHVGILVGKFFPLHRGHLTHIFNAYSQCDQLNIIICDNIQLDMRLCKEANIKYISADTRLRWLKTELKGFNNIKIHIMKEPNDMPEYPIGWPQWSKCLNSFIYDYCTPYTTDIKFTIFTGELNDVEFYKSYFPEYDIKYFDYSMTRYPISATQIRKNPLQYWDYICGSARKHFAKKILITGTESTGKTTLVKMLAKIFHTSWAEEMGRIYVEQNVNDERYITDEDYFNIIRLQIEANDHALKTCNRLCFFDTDIVVTYYYYRLYKNENDIYEISDSELNLFNSIYDAYYKDLYDYRFFLSFEGVPWVSDGLRRHEDYRDELDGVLLEHYQNFNIRDFTAHPKMEIVKGNYHNRLSYMYKFCQSLINH
ncbi:MAG: AAA family ATPase [Candidatus Nanoarchaeia archaeon]|nr:AAA family ATPase [Candidatus Nanoarchaeia archaeon]